MTVAFDTALSGEQITADRDTDLSTRNGQRRYLCDHLGIDQRQARLLIAAYEQDVADALRIGNDTERSDFEFMRWLMEERPLGLTPHRKTPAARVGDPAWPLKSS